jgi:hypothetical protein
LPYTKHIDRSFERFPDNRLSLMIERVLKRRDGEPDSLSTNRLRNRAKQHSSLPSIPAIGFRDGHLADANQ